MAKTKISEFSSTPANNTDIDSINIAEGCAPSGINDAIRELMAQLKDFQTGAVGDSFNGPVGTTTAAAGAFTTLSATGAITSTLATGTAPFTIASTTKVSNLNVDLLDGADWAAPAALGSTTPAAVSATTLSASSTVTLSGGTANGVAYLNGSKVVTSGSALTFDGTTFTSVGQINVKNDLLLSDSTATQGRAYGDASGVVWRAESGLAQRWHIGSTEQMRLNSTGLGIGTSSPSQKLHVVGNSRFGNSGADAQIQILGPNGYGEFIYFGESGAADRGVLGYSTGSGTLQYRYGASTISNGTLGFAIDTSGNLGLGVTPSAGWDSNGFVSMAFKNAGNNLSANGAGYFEISQNAVWNSGWKYANTATASRYELGEGKHMWFTAPSGTAGNAITFTQALTLDASGNLLVSTTSQIFSGKFCISSPLASTNSIALQNTSTQASGQSFMYMANSAGNKAGSIDHSGTTTVAYTTSSDYRLKENVQPMVGALDKVQALKPVTYTWKEDGSSSQGFIAHELQAVVPECVVGEKDAVDAKGNPVYQGIDTSFLVATLTAAIQELKAEFDAYKVAHP